MIPEPATGLEVKFSLPHLAAMTILGRSTASIGDADAADAEAVALRSRVMLTPDGEPGAPTRVEVQLRDGSRLSAAHDVNAPEADLGAQGARLAEKFRVLAEPVLGAERREALLAALTELDETRAGARADAGGAARLGARYCGAPAEPGEGARVVIRSSLQSDRANPAYPRLSDFDLDAHGLHDVRREARGLRARSRSREARTSMVRNASVPAHADPRARRADRVRVAGDHRLSR